MIWWLALLCLSVLYWVDGVLDACSDNDLTSSASKTVYLRDYRPYPWTLSSDYQLNFILDRTTTVVTSKFVLTPRGSQAVIVLDGSRDTLLQRLSINDTPIYVDGKYTNTETGWSLCLDDTRTHQLKLSRSMSEEPVLLDIEVTISPKNNTELFGLYESEELLVTQNEAWGFRRITYYPDRPDVSAVFNVTITADESLYPVILSNGNLLSDEKNADGTHTVHYIDPYPKPPYLFALVAGSLESIESTVEINLPCVEAIAALHQIPTGDAQVDPLVKYCALNDAQRESNTTNVLIKAWGRPGTGRRLRWALDSVYKAMLWDEIVYGRVYDLDQFHIVAVKDFNAGAMENKGLNIFNIALIEALPEIATDQQYIRIRGVVAHEYFHNWSGDRVTLRDWFQLTLKEGFTVFRDEQFTEDITKSSVKRLQDAKFMIDAQFRQDASPLSHPIRPDSYQSIENFYTLTVYEKGAEVIRMLHTLLGWHAFRRGTDFYFDRYDGTGATCEDFLSSMERVSGRDLRQFKLWYTTPGTPVVTVESQEYDEENGRYTMVLKQTSNSTEPLLIPIKFTLWNSRGSPEQLIPEVVIELKEMEEQFVFEEINEKPVASLLRGFSAPVRVKPFLDEASLLRLAMHDSDGYVRWQSAQSVMTIAVKQRLQIAKLPPSRDLLYLYKTIITQIESAQNLDMYLLSYILRLPPVSSFEDQLEEYRPEKVHEVLLAFKQEIAETFREDMFGIVEASDERLAGLEYDVRPLQVGIRALKNLFLDFLSKNRNDPVVKQKLQTQLESASTENDRAAALSIIADYPPSDWRESMLQKYYEMNKNEPVLMDRWLAAQASSYASDTLDKVVELMQHPLYATSTTPNRLRSLMNVLAGNPVWFHEPNGRGYELVASEVLRWDKFNAKLAARLATSFSHGNRLPLKRRRLMSKQVERILSSESLSLNTREIASKILEGLQSLSTEDKRSEL